MKEATGELNMTVITIIMIGAILAFFWLIWSNIKNKVNESWDNATDPTDYSYNEVSDNKDIAVSHDGINYTLIW